jgi:dihydroorotate dehydrogenase electron transfer subunit
VEISQLTVPGQFVQVRISRDPVPLWPRPFSIFDVNADKGEISIVFKVAGHGTRILSEKNEGDLVSIFGPLGNGFSIPENNQEIIMAAGGVGLPPLYLLSKFSVDHGFPSKSIKFISGAKTGSQLFDCKELTALNTDLRVCTDDGSVGVKGTVVDILDRILDKEDNLKVYACGPSGMLKKVDEILVERNIAGFLSLEQLMPCGYGICSGCAVKVSPSPDRGETDDNRDYHLKRVCVEGPVFKSGEVIWE